MNSLNQLTLSLARKWQSKQTGFVHYCYSESESEVQQMTIPMVENMLFVLALLKTKTIEQMTEAKELLEKLLWFQNPKEGSFPVYLHEYPESKDRCIGSQLLPVFYYILIDFQTILGFELRQRLIQATIKLMDYSLSANKDKKPSYALDLKLAASLKVLGLFLNEKNYEEKGNQLLKETSLEEIHPAWFQPSAIADICVALQLLDPNLLKGPWKIFSQHLIQTWHQPTKTYMGPALRQYQSMGEPQVTLYDLILGYLSDGFSVRALNEHPCHFYATLIRVTEDRLPSLSFPLHIEGKINNYSWLVHQEEKYAYSLIDNRALSNPAYANAFNPLYIIWGDNSYVHTFVCQGGNLDTFDFSTANHEIYLNVNLAPTIEVEDREKARELAFYFDIEPDVQLIIQGEKATTFDLAEEFTLKTPQIQLSFRAFLEEGSGEFIGHIMRGNRPSQIRLKGADRFNAYDWQLFLRTLRRSGPCRFKVILKMKVCA